jgi:hypothetical protein
MFPRIPILGLFVYDVASVGIASLQSSALFFCKIAFTIWYSTEPNEMIILRQSIAFRFVELPTIISPTIEAERPTFIPGSSLNLSRTRQDPKTIDDAMKQVNDLKIQLHSARMYALEKETELSASDKQIEELRKKLQEFVVA